MAWSHQAPSHYLNQHLPWSISPYGVTMIYSLTFLITLYETDKFGMLLPWNQFQPEICLLGNLILRIWNGLWKWFRPWQFRWDLIPHMISSFADIIYIWYSSWNICRVIFEVTCLVIYDSPYCTVSSAIHNSLIGAIFPVKGILKLCGDLTKW